VSVKPTQPLYVPVSIDFFNSNVAVEKRFLEKFAEMKSRQDDL